MVKKALKPKSYFQLSADLGNNYFSIKNKRIGASQLESKLVFTPAVSYFHKSGLALSAASFLTSFNGKSDFYQFSLTPSYAFTKSKKVSVSVSYTRFFRRSGFADASSPIQNDLFAMANLKKPWLQPGISLGFSGGNNTEYNKVDTVYNGIRRRFIDTIKTRINSFSFNVFVQHSFEYLGIIKKDDGISITPRLILNAGSNRYTEKHYNPYISYLNRVLQRRTSIGRLQENTSFQVQSVAGSLDISYLIGKFGLTPQVYLDYYIPESTDKKFTAVYSFVLSYTF